MAPQAQHKTLPHALGRAATSAAQGLGSEDRLGRALALYAGGYDKVATARLQQDESIRVGFLHPWQTTLSTSIQVAMRARQAVKVSRLELDAAKQTYVVILSFFALYLTSVCRLKNANPSKQEHARLEVENAEDDLVQKTEVAITLMKTVLENVSLILALLFTLLIVACSRNPLRTSMNLPSRSCCSTQPQLRHCRAYKVKLRS